MRDSSVTESGQFYNCDLVFGVRFIRSGAGPALLLLGEPCAGMSGCGMTPALVIAHRRLKALGVQIAMDDFGTDYSSLATFQAFPFDKIKIDRFVGKLEVQPQAAVIVRAVLGLGRSLGMGVVAEGVETEAQMKFLTAEACDEVQGYFFGRPQPIEQFAHAIYGKSPAWTDLIGCVKRS